MKRRRKDKDRDWKLQKSECYGDEMILDVDMLRTSVMLVIVCEGDSALVVAVDEILMVDVVADFSEKAEETD